jgi:hypothetical protein
MSGAVDDASEASRAIGARTDELGGALGHRGRICRTAIGVDQRRMWSAIDALLVGDCAESARMSRDDGEST